MNIKIIICLVIVLLFGFLFFTFRKNIFRNPTQLEITYKISAGIPFKWEHDIADESVVGYVKSYVVKNYNTGGKVGAPIITNYVFKGLKKGRTTITFKLVSITNEEVQREDKYEVIVDKNLHITLVGEK